MSDDASPMTHPASRTDQNSSHEAGVLQRAFTILNCFSSDNPSLTLTDIMNMTGYAPSTVSRFLTSLVQVRALVKNGNKRYSIGPSVMELAQLAGPMPSVREAASGFLDELARVTHLHVQLASRVAWASGESGLDIHGLVRWPNP